LASDHLISSFHSTYRSPGLNTYWALTVYLVTCECPPQIRPLLSDEPGKGEEERNKGRKEPDPQTPSAFPAPMWPPPAPSWGATTLSLLELDASARVPEGRGPGPAPSPGPLAPDRDQLAAPQKGTRPDGAAGAQVPQRPGVAKAQSDSSPGPSPLGRVILPTPESDPGGFSCRSHAAVTSRSHLLRSCGSARALGLLRAPGAPWSCGSATPAA
jgi:hypothetical protein